MLWSLRIAFKIDAGRVLYLFVILRGDLEGGVVAVGLAIAPVLGRGVEVAGKRVRGRRGLCPKNLPLGPVRETKAGENRDDGHQQEPARASHGDTPIIARKRALHKKCDIRIR